MEVLDEKSKRVIPGRNNQQLTAVYTREDFERFYGKSITQIALGKDYQLLLEAPKSEASPKKSRKVGTMKEHSVGDFLQKNGNVYKIMPFQDHNEELAELGLVSIFLNNTNEIFNTPFLIKKDDPSFTEATNQQKEDFIKAEQKYK